MQRAFGELSNQFDTYYKRYVDNAIEILRQLESAGKLKDDQGRTVHLVDKSVEEIEATSVLPAKELWIMESRNGESRRVIPDQGTLDSVRKELQQGLSPTNVAFEEAERLKKFFTDDRYANNSCNAAKYIKDVDQKTGLLKTFRNHEGGEYALDITYEALGVDVLTDSRTVDTCVQYVKDGTPFNVNFGAAVQLLRCIPEIVVELTNRVKLWQATNSKPDEEIDKYIYFIQTLTGEAGQSELSKVYDAVAITENPNRLRDVMTRIQQVYLSDDLTCGPVTGSMSFDNDVFVKCDVSLRPDLIVRPKSNDKEYTHIPFHSVTPRTLQDGLFEIVKSRANNKNRITVGKYLYLPRYILVRVDRWIVGDQQRSDQDLSYSFDGSRMTVPVTLDFSAKAAADNDHLHLLMHPQTGIPEKKTFDLVGVTVYKQAGHATYRRNRRTDTWMTFEGEHQEPGKTLPVEAGIPSDKLHPTDAKCVYLLYRAHASQDAEISAAAIKPEPISKPVLSATTEKISETRTYSTLQAGPAEYTIRLTVPRSLQVTDSQRNLWDPDISTWPRIAGGAIIETPSGPHKAVEVPANESRYLSAIAISRHHVLTGEMWDPQGGDQPAVDAEVRRYREFIRDETEKCYVADPNIGGDHSNHYQYMTYPRLQGLMKLRDFLDECLPVFSTMKTLLDLKTKEQVRINSFLRPVINRYDQQYEEFCTKHFGVFPTADGAVPADPVGIYRYSYLKNAKLLEVRVAVTTAVANAGIFARDHYIRPKRVIGNILREPEYWLHIYRILDSAAKRRRILVDIARFAQVLTILRTEIDAQISQIDADKSVGLTEAAITSVKTDAKIIEMIEPNHRADIDLFELPLTDDAACFDRFFVVMEEFNRQFVNAPGKTVDVHHNLLQTFTGVADEKTELVKVQYDGHGSVWRAIVPEFWQRDAERVYSNEANKTDTTYPTRAYWACVKNDSIAYGLVRVDQTTKSAVTTPLTVGGYSFYKDHAFSRYLPEFFGGSLAGSSVLTRKYDAIAGDPKNYQMYPYLIQHGPVYYMPTILPPTEPGWDHNNEIYYRLFNILAKDTVVLFSDNDIDNIFLRNEITVRLDEPVWQDNDSDDAKSHKDAEPVKSNSFSNTTIPQAFGIITKYSAVSASLSVVHRQKIYIDSYFKILEAFVQNGGKIILPASGLLQKQYAVGLRACVHTLAQEDRAIATRIQDWLYYLSKDREKPDDIEDDDLLTDWQATQQNKIAESEALKEDNVKKNGYALTPSAPINTNVGTQTTIPPGNASVIRLTRSDGGNAFDVDTLVQNLPNEVCYLWGAAASQQQGGSNKPQINLDLLPPFLRVDKSTTANLRVLQVALRTCTTAVAATIMCRRNQDNFKDMQTGTAQRVQNSVEMAIDAGSEYGLDKKARDKLLKDNPTFKIFEEWMIVCIIGSAITVKIAASDTPEAVLSDRAAYERIAKDTLTAAVLNYHSIIPPSDETQMGINPAGIISESVAFSETRDVKDRLFQCLQICLNSYFIAPTEEVFEQTMKGLGPTFDTSLKQKILEQSSPVNQAVSQADRFGRSQEVASVTALLLFSKDLSKQQDKYQYFADAVIKGSILGARTLPEQGQVQKLLSTAIVGRVTITSASTVGWRKNISDYVKSFVSKPAATSTPVNKPLIKPAAIEKKQLLFNTVTTNVNNSCYFAVAVQLLARIYGYSSNDDQAQIAKDSGKAAYEDICALIKDLAESRDSVRVVGPDTPVSLSGKTYRNIHFDAQTWALKLNPNSRDDVNTKYNTYRSPWDFIEPVLTESETFKKLTHYTTRRTVTCLPLGPVSSIVADSISLSSHLIIDADLGTSPNIQDLVTAETVKRNLIESEDCAPGAGPNAEEKFEIIGGTQFVIVQLSQRAVDEMTVNKDRVTVSPYINIPDNNEVDVNYKIIAAILAPGGHFTFADAAVTTTSDTSTTPPTVYSTINWRRFDDLISTINIISQETVESQVYYLLYQLDPPPPPVKRGRFKGGYDMSKLPSPGPVLRKYPGLYSLPLHLSDTVKNDIETRSKIENYVDRIKTELYDIVVNEGGKLWIPCVNNKWYFENANGNRWDDPASYPDDPEKQAVYKYYSDKLTQVLDDVCAPIS